MGVQLKSSSHREAPQTSHKGALIATVGLLLLWNILCLGAEIWQTPFQNAGSTLEILFGLDVLPGVKDS